MPNTEQIRKAQERREARKNAQLAAIDAANEQDANLSETIKASQKAATKAPPRKTVSRAELRKAKQAAAEKQADADVRVVAKPSDIEAALEIGRQGGEIPLHVMNQMAKVASHELRDEARDIADAAGKAAFQVATGKIASRRTRGNRFSRMRDAQALMDKTNAEKAAAAAAGQ